MTRPQPDIVPEPPSPHAGSPAGTVDRVARSTGRGERTRRRILDAAESVFAQFGFHDASIVRITEEAGVAQGTFYIYFSSKQQVFDEVVLDLNHRVRQAMAQASEGATSRLDAERRGFAAFFAFTAEHPSLYRLIRQAEFVSPEIHHRHYERIISGYIPHLEKAMASGEVARSDPTVLAWALIAVGEMTGMKWILWDDRSSMPQDVFDQLVAIIGRMLGSSELPADPSSGASSGSAADPSADPSADPTSGPSVRSPGATRAEPNARTSTRSERKRRS